MGILYFEGFGSSVVAEPIQNNVRLQIYEKIAKCRWEKNIYSGNAEIIAT
jgi:hypothetical protein